MTINSYDIGDTVRCAVRFSNVDDAVFDPTTVRFKLRSPANGVVTVYEYGPDVELVREGMGEYYVDVSVALSGKWHYRFDGLGPNQTASETYFLVRPSIFTA